MIYFQNYLFLFLAAQCLCCWAQAFSHYGEWELLSSCSAWASHYSGFSSCTDSRVHGLQKLSHVGSVIVAQVLEHGLSTCGARAYMPVTCGIFPVQSVSQFSCSVMSNSVTPWSAAQQTSLSITRSRVYSNSCPLSR